MQPNNANNMGDLDSIIRTTLGQYFPVDLPQGSPPLRQNQVPQYNYTPPHASQQQQQYEPLQQQLNQQPQQLNQQPQQQLNQQPQQQLNQQPQQLNQQPQQQLNQQPQLYSLSQLMMMQLEPPDIERLAVSHPNMQRITLAEFQRLQRLPRPTPYPQQGRNNGWHIMIGGRRRTILPVGRIALMHSQPQPDNSEATSSENPEQNSQSQSAKMLLFLHNGEQRLINFTLPEEHSRLPEVLKQVILPFSKDAPYQCVHNTMREIDYFVSVAENNPTRNQNVRPQPMILTVSSDDLGTRLVNLNNHDIVASGRKPTECMVCCEISEGNCQFQPCGHRIACEDCAARIKKCITCGVAIERRMTNDGRLLTERRRSPNVERLRLLEYKVQKLQEKLDCSICMERRRSVAFQCGHQACTACANTLTVCHMCRQPITAKINLY